MNVSESPVTVGMKKGKEGHSKERSLHQSGQVPQEDGMRNDPGVGEERRGR